MARMCCTVQMARKLHPGAKHSLDALCTRYGIDRSHRVKHGALLDAELLAHLYIEMTGGRQIGLGLAATAAGTVRSEEHTSELQSLMRISYAVFCMTKKETKQKQQYHLN